MNQAGPARPAGRGRPAAKRTPWICRGFGRRRETVASRRWQARDIGRAEARGGPYTRALRRHG